MSTTLARPPVPSTPPIPSSQAKVKWTKMQIQQAIALKLPAFEPSDWTTWSMQAKPLLQLAGILEVVEGRPCPPEADDDSTSYDNWTDKNKIAAMHILNCLSTNLKAKYIKYSKNSAQLWKELEAEFAVKSATLVMITFHKICTLKMEYGTDIYTHITALDTLLTRLSILRGTNGGLTDEEAKVALLQSLPESWSFWVDRIMAYDISYTELCNRARERERLQPKTENIAMAAKAKAQQFNKKSQSGSNNQQNYGGETEPKSLCYYCWKPGHFAKKCREKQADEDKGIFQRSRPIPAYIKAQLSSSS